MRRAAAAPRCHRRLGLTTVVLLGLSSLGFAASQALAGQVSEPQLPTEPTTTSSTTGATVQAPGPDPKPAPKPDPKPAARPKPPVPRGDRRLRPSPPATRRTAARSTSALAKRRSTRRASLRKRAASAQRTARANRLRAAARKKRAAAAAIAARRRARVNAVREARRVARAVRTRKAKVAARKRILAARKRIRASAAAPAGAPLDHEALPAPVLARSEPQLSVAVPLLLPLFGVGMLLLLGASLASFRQIPLPALAQPLYARRADVAAIGFGAIALGLLLLNAAVFF